jgi:hypothetical protein
MYDTTIIKTNTHWSLSGWKRNYALLSRFVFHMEAAFEYACKCSTIGWERTGRRPGKTLAAGSKTAEHLRHKKPLKCAWTGRLVKELLVQLVPSTELQSFKEIIGHDIANPCQRRKCPTISWESLKMNCLEGFLRGTCIHWTRKDPCNDPSEDFYCNDPYWEDRY